MVGVVVAAAAATVVTVYGSDGDVGGDPVVCTRKRHRRRLDLRRRVRRRFTDDDGVTSPTGTRETSRTRRSRAASSVAVHRRGWWTRGVSTGAGVRARARPRESAHGRSVCAVLPSLSLSLFRPYKCVFLSLSLSSRMTVFGSPSRTRFVPHFLSFLATLPLPIAVSFTSPCLSLSHARALLPVRQ